jgi:hypothetical protein
MKMDEGKRLLTTALVSIISAVLIAVNKKVDLGLSDATITALAANIGLVAGVYIWGQTRTDQTEKKTDE